MVGISPPTATCISPNAMHRLLTVLLACVSFALVDKAVADSKVPIIGNHNKIIRLQAGDHLSLECPVHNEPSNSLIQSEPTQDAFSSVMYHWQVRDRLDYSLDSDPRYRLSQNRRVLEVTVPVSSIDSGNYTCTGVTGFGQREVTFEVHVRDPDENLLCATPSVVMPNLKVPCFLDPTLKISESINIERTVGSSVQFNCLADGSEPMRYRWFMGTTVADWVTTSHGAREPTLTIDRLGREHTGQYTCQVSNPAGSLNYTYRLLVTDLPSSSPKIISSMQNQTLSPDDNAVFVVRIQCACNKPVIQWLKRVDSEEMENIYGSDLKKHPLPNARESEKDESYILLGSQSDSPVMIDNPVSYLLDHKSSSFQRGTGNSISDGSTFYSVQSQPKQPQEHIFVSRMHLKKPLSKEKHQGKYVIMAASLSNLKNAEYAVMYVDIIQDPVFLKGRRMLLYTLVPFSLLFVAFGMTAYFFVCRHRRPLHRASGLSNDRCILRTSTNGQQAYHVMSNGKKTSSNNTSSRYSSTSNQTGKQTYTLLGIQSPLLQTDVRTNGVKNGFEKVNSVPNTNYPINGMHMPISLGNEVLCQTPAYVASNHHPPPQRNLPYPPPMQTIAVANGINQQPPNTYPAYYAPTTVPVNTQYQQSTASNPLANTALSPSSVTEISFDQYSAVSRSQLSSGTPTNHYTAPFNEYTRQFSPDGMDSGVFGQQPYYKA